MYEFMTLYDWKMTNICQSWLLKCCFSLFCIILNWIPLHCRTEQDVWLWQLIDYLKKHRLKSHKIVASCCCLLFCFFYSFLSCHAPFVLPQFSWKKCNPAECIIRGGDESTAGRGARGESGRETSQWHSSSPLSHHCLSSSSTSPTNKRTNCSDKAGGGANREGWAELSARSAGLISLVSLTALSGHLVGRWEQLQVPEVSLRTIPTSVSELDEGAGWTRGGGLAFITLRRFS